MDIIPRKRRASEGSDTSSDSEAIAAVEAALHSQDQQQQPEMPRISSVEMLDLPPGCIPMAPEDDKNASSTTWYPCSMEGCLRRYKHKKNLAFHIKNDHCDPSDMKVVTCPHEGCGKIFKYTSVMKRHCLLFHSGPEVREGQLRKRRKGKTPRGESAAGESQRWRVLVGSSEVEVDDGEEVQQAAMKEPSDGEGWPLSTTGDDAVTVVGASSASATEVATAGGGEGDYRAVMGIMGTTGATSKLYQCLFPGCEKVFTSKGSWGMHRDSIHVKPHSFVCPVETCGRKFSYKHVMQTHCERVHGMETGRAGGKARSAKQRQQQQQPSTESLTAAAAAAAEEEEKEEGAEDTNRDPATSSSSSSSLSGRRRLPTEAAITTASGGASTSASSTSTSVGRGTDTGAWGGGILGVAGVAREREDGEADPADVAAFTLAGGEEEGGIQKSVPQLYPCDFPGCTKVFSWKGSLALHYDRIHKLHKAFVCPMQGCDKAFSYKHVLKSHLRRIHKLDPAPAPAAGSISEAAADGASSPNSNSNSDTAAAVPADAATTTTTTTTGTDVGDGVIDGLTSSYRKEFWKLANKCQQQAHKIIEEYDMVPESVRLFGLGMDSPIDILQAVEIDARSAASFGRGFSCGVSNMGVVDFPNSQKQQQQHQQQRQQVGVEDVGSAAAVSVKEAYYATSHGRNGVMYQLSCMTIDNALCGCLQFTSPLVTEEEADYVRDKVQFILQNI